VPSLRDIRGRIQSVKNTQKITKALQVVAATRLRRAQGAVQATRPYAEKMLEVMQTTAELTQEYRHPFLEPRQGSRAVMILITSDRGLAGALNSNNIRIANRYLNEHYPERPRWVTIGRKGRDFLLRYRRQVLAEVTGLPELSPPVAQILPAVTVALDEYRRGEADAVLLAYARWVSTLRQVATVTPLVPFEIPERDATGPRNEYIYEPGPEEVLDALLPRYVETQVYQAVLENLASFHSAQMIAMQNATNAAGDLIEDLTLTANKVRQSTITTELMEIVSGADALRGSEA
jgi:F-type H+-transporting ATPase subunit gamma